MRPANQKYWNRVTPAQMRLLEAVCAGKDLIDLGGRDGSLALHLLGTGAKSAVNVDHDRKMPRRKDARLAQFTGTFAEFNARNHGRQWDVAILSWPVIYASMLDPVIPILDRCDRIVYLGKNNPAVQCGTRRLWRYLVRRQLEDRIERKSSALLIYGGPGRTVEKTEEESWGLKAIPR